MLAYRKYRDTELATLLRDGDERAFKTIYERFWQKMYVVARNRLNDATEAEEVVQDILLSLWKKRKTFVLRTTFDQYLAVAVKFEVITRRAKRAREAKLLREMAENTRESDRISLPTDLEELERQLEQTIETLPSKCKLVFKTRWENGYTNKKTAAELDISEKTVEKHISHALKVLRTRFGNYLPLFLLLLRNYPQ